MLCADSLNCKLIGPRSGPIGAGWLSGRVLDLRSTAKVEGLSLAGGTVLCPYNLLSTGRPILT